MDRQSDDPGPFVLMRSSPDLGRGIWNSSMVRGRLGSQKTVPRMKDGPPATWYPAAVAPSTPEMDPLPEYHRQEERLAVVDRRRRDRDAEKKPIVLKKKKALRRRMQCRETSLRYGCQQCCR